MYLVTGHKNFLTKKDYKIKMSSLLNVSNVSNESEEFSLKDIEAIVDSKEQNWFKRAHVGKFLGIVNIRRSTAKLADEDQKTWAFLQAEGGVHIMNTPREDAQDHDIFISLTGALYVVVNSRKDKGKALKKHILKDIAPRGFDVRIEEIQGKHQQAIEEKDAATALLNDDLKNRDNQIQAIQYENVALQAQRDVYKDQLQKCQDIITHLRTRHVPHTKDPGKDNIVMIIEKNTAPEEDEFYEYPYYPAKIQRRFINTKRRWFKAQYPHHRFIMEELGNANSIHAFNKFEEKGYVERFQCHFRLVDILGDALYALATPTILNKENEEE